LTPSPASPASPGAVIVYFAAQPKLQLQFCGIVDAPLPGLAKRVQSAVEPQAEKATEEGALGI